jgi:hypothetical protein
MKRVLGQVLTMETGYCNITTVSKNFCQTVLNMWNWIVPHTHNEQTATQLHCHSWKTQKLDSQETEQTILLKGWLSSFQFVCDLLHCTDSTKGR